MVPLDYYLSIYQLDTGTGAGGGREVGQSSRNGTSILITCLSQGAEGVSVHVTAAQDTQVLITLVIYLDVYAISSSDYILPSMTL